MPSTWPALPTVSTANRKMHGATTTFSSPDIPSPGRPRWFKSTTSRNSGTNERRRRLSRGGVVAGRGVKAGVTAAAWLLACLWTTAVLGAAPPPEQAYNHTVSKSIPWAHSPFISRVQASVGVLNTKPDAGERFIKDESAIADGKRHGTATWFARESTPTLFQAVSPPLPANTTSYVICLGLFVPPSRPGPGPATPIGLHWRSQLHEAGKHIIVVNSYNNGDDRGSSPATSMNAWAYASALALKTEVYARAQNVFIIRCGFEGDIRDITELPGYLQKLGVATDEVVSYDSIGHGLRFAVDDAQVRIMRCARQGSSSEHYVGRTIDFEMSKKLDTNIQTPMSSGDYAALIKGFLRQHAFVSLLHCFTGEQYAAPVGEGVKVGSIAAQVKHALRDKEVVTVGMRGKSYVGLRNNGVEWEGVVPRPMDRQDRWVVPAIEKGVYYD